MEEAFNAEVEEAKGDMMEAHSAEQFSLNLYWLREQLEESARRARKHLEAIRGFSFGALAFIPPSSIVNLLERAEREYPGGLDRRTYMANIRSSQPGREVENILKHVMAAASEQPKRLERPTALLTEPWVRNSRKKSVCRDLRPKPPARKT
jgi:hypothetical protein